MNDWILDLTLIVAAADLFLIPAALSEHRKARGRRLLAVSMIGLQVLFVLLLGVILLAGLPLAGELAALVAVVIVLVVEYRLRVLWEGFTRDEQR